MYDEIMQPDEKTEAYQTLQGFHTRSVDVSRAMWRLSRVVKKSPTLSKLFEDEVVERDRRRARQERRRRVRSTRKLRDFLEEFGWRSDAVYDLADIPWREDESIALSSIAGFVDLDDSEDPERLYQKAVKQREELLAKARAKLASDPATAREVRRALRGRPLQLPRHRGSRVLHRPARRRCLSPVRARRRRPPRAEGRHRQGRRRVLPPRAPRCPTRC